jgi:hypothetical protein
MPARVALVCTTAGMAGGGGMRGTTKAGPGGGAAGPVTSTTSKDSSTPTGPAREASQGLQQFNPHHDSCRARDLKYHEKISCPSRQLQLPLPAAVGGCFEP